VDEQTKTELLSAGYSRYVVAQHKPGETPELDIAADKLPDTFDIEGSVREEAAGGKALRCRIALEDDSFVVYLPPEDPNWGAKSQIITPGYRPCQEGALREFHRWLARFCKHND